MYEIYVLMQESVVEKDIRYFVDNRIYLSIINKSVIFKGEKYLN